MNLVIQSPGLTSAQAREIARLAGSTRIEKITGHAWRVRDAAAADSIAGYAERNQIDFAFIPEGRRFADLKLVAMDMDSTLINIECIDELGDFAGRKAEVARSEERRVGKECRSRW